MLNKKKKIVIIFFIIWSFYNLVRFFDGENLLYWKFIFCLVSFLIFSVLLFKNFKKNNNEKTQL